MTKRNVSPKVIVAARQVLTRVKTDTLITQYGESMSGLIVNGGRAITNTKRVADGANFMGHSASNK